MTIEQEFLSFYMFETDGGVANAIDKFTLLEGINLTDKIFDANIAGSTNIIDKILQGVSAYLDVGEEYEDVERKIHSGQHGYYVDEMDVIIFIHMMEKRRPIFDAILQAYNITIPGMIWR